MISASNNSQNKGTDNLQNETDKLLSDKYILAKEIRDLIKTINSSKTTLSILNIELKNKSEMKDQLEKDINKVDENDIIHGKQPLSDNILTLTNEIKCLREKTENIDLADAVALAELNQMKAQLKEIEEEITGQKYKEEQGMEWNSFIRKPCLKLESKCEGNN